MTRIILSVALAAAVIAPFARNTTPAPQHTARVATSNAVDSADVELRSGYIIASS